MSLCTFANMTKNPKRKCPEWTNEHLELQIWVEWFTRTPFLKWTFLTDKVDSGFDDVGSPTRFNNSRSNDNIYILLLKEISLVISNRS